MISLVEYEPEWLTDDQRRNKNCRMSETSISVYVPDDQELYKTIIGVDSIFWESYNSCNMDIQKTLYSENIKFYHDQSGLIASKQQILDATESSVCGQIRRPLSSRPGKFIIIWRQLGSEWSNCNSLK